MRLPRPQLVAIVLGFGVVGVSVSRVLAVSTAGLALFVAAAILTELVEEADRHRSRDAVELERFHIAAAVQVAALIVLGPWAGALVAAAGVIAGALFRGTAVEAVLYRASALALASAAAGGTFLAAGGHTGSLTLLQDLLPLVVLGVVYLTLRALLIDVVLARESFEPRLTASAGEVALGAVIALLAIRQPWDVIAVVPIGLALHWTQLQTTRLQRDTLRALETFANIVDERDPSTYRHSIRVAAYVDELARGLRLSFSDIDRLRWAGRLHDLGKVAVDSVVLRKPESLDGAEWAAVRRHPRLSARLLRRFQFVAMQSRAVELHHERMDGLGYYGVDGEQLPLAAHFLIVADSFDAMTTDRPYRPALSHDEALLEIERNVGSQFHPAVAKAFVAVRRGLDPAAVLTQEEHDFIRAASTPYRLGTAFGPRLKEHPELLVLGGITLALGGLGFGETSIAIAGAAVAMAGAALRAVAHVRSERLREALLGSLGASERELVLWGLFVQLSRSWSARWAGLVAWAEDGLGGLIEHQIGQGPTEDAITSWLVREADSGADLIVTPGHELGREGVVLALPLRRETSAVAGFLVLEATGHPPQHVELALRECLDEIGLALAGRAELVPPQELTQPTPVHVFASANGNGGNGNGRNGNGNGAVSRPRSNGSTIVAARVEQPRAPVADALHGAADCVLQCLSLSANGELASSEAESDEALEAARVSLARYRSLSTGERSETADGLARAVDDFLRWPLRPEDERDDFTVVLEALETASSRYGATAAQHLAPKVRNHSNG